MAGKTFFMTKHIRVLAADVKKAHKREARILIVSSRKTLTTAYLADPILKELGFAAYNEPKLLKASPLDLESHPRTIWQIDSLPRGFERHMPGFDAIYIDEVAQMQAHVYQGRSAHTAVDQRQAHLSGLALTGLHTLRMLCEQAQVVVVMDNDLTEATVDAFTSTVRANRPYRVVQCTSQPWAEQCKASILLGDKGQQEATQKLIQHVREQKAAKRDGRVFTNTTGQDVILTRPCRSL